MMELLKNPVTIIAGILSLFFLLMAFGRHVAKKRLAAPPKALRKDEHYTFVDPYETAPPEAVAQSSGTPGEPADDTATGETTPHLKEYRPASSNAQPGQSAAAGYLWE